MRRRILLTCAVLVLTQLFAGFTPLAGSTFCIPFLSTGAGDFAGVAVANYSGRQVDLVFRAYSTDGLMFDLPENPRRVSLEDSQQMALLVSELFGESVILPGWIELESDSPQVASFFQIGSSDFLDGAVAAAVTGGRLIFARVFEGEQAFRGQPATTLLSVVNPNSEVVRVQLSVSSPGQETVSSERLVPGKGAWIGGVSDLVPAGTDLAGGVIELVVLEGAPVAAAELILVGGKRSLVGLTAVSPSIHSRLYSAQIASLPGTIFTSLKLINSGSAARNVTLTALDDGGTLLAEPVERVLAAGGYLEEDLGHLFGFRSDRLTVGTLRVDADGEGLLGDVIFGEDSRAAYLAACPLQGDGVNRAVLSHVADAGAFFTGLAIHNPGLFPAAVEIEAFAPDGRLTGRNAALTLPPGSRLSRLLHELLPDAQGQSRGYLRVSSSRPLILEELFGSSRMLSAVPARDSAVSTVVVDTGQEECFDAANEIPCPMQGEPFYGQDGQVSGNVPSYTDNEDGTVSDNRTGLMWQKAPGPKLTWDEAVQTADSFELAGYDDWRLPTIKELYSLIDFSGIDPSGWNDTETSSLKPFIDTDYFDFEFGDPSDGDRIIDAQYWSSTQYVSTTMAGNQTAFGVNFADGRIKGYPTGPVGPPGSQSVKAAFVKYVRGNPLYGLNQFVDNGDGTITDCATGLMWTKSDSGRGMKWEDALKYAEDLTAGGYSDWRLPNAKELQSIVDYTRSPATTDSPAIDPIFDASAIINEGGQVDYPFYWTGTTHISMSDLGAGWAAYVAFGRALGFMEMPPFSGNFQLLDVHGAGAQRSDPKAGDPRAWSGGHGPQGDVVRIYNYVRCVRGGS